MNFLSSRSKVAKCEGHHRTMTESCRHHTFWFLIGAETERVGRGVALQPAASQTLAQPTAFNIGRKDAPLRSVPDLGASNQESKWSPRDLTPSVVAGYAPLGHQDGIPSNPA